MMFVMCERELCGSAYLVALNEIALSRAGTEGGQSRQQERERERACMRTQMYCGMSELECVSGGMQQQQ